MTATNLGLFRVHCALLITQAWQSQCFFFCRLTRARSSPWSLTRPSTMSTKSKYVRRRLGCGDKYGDPHCTRVPARISHASSSPPDSHSHTPRAYDIHRISPKDSKTLIPPNPNIRRRGLPRMSVCTRRSWRSSTCTAKDKRQSTTCTRRCVGAY